MNTSEYLESVSKRFKSGISKEHAYRSDLEQLIRTLVGGVDVTNEPANVTDCGNPDYVITKKKIPIGYIEAKDVDKDLHNKSYKEQFTRYKNALDNLIITDYLWFQFFDHGKLVFEIRIGKVEENKITPLPENFSEFENRIIEFCDFVGQTIKSSNKLAEMMAGKARLLQNILERVVTSDEEKQENSSLQDQYKSFKNILIHDLKPKEFADIYAQTLAYGMFAARLHDPTLENFTRQEASELIPKTNPFLRKLFGHVAGPDIDERIKTTVDNLADVFRATDVDGLLKNFGKSTQTEDAIIHFYETFLAKYDPKLRKSRGVWYTPEPVVKFIVRAVDDILKTEFRITKGLADTSKVKIKIPEERGRRAREEEVHKVQILDPAVGTGTFLAEVIKLIYTNHFENKMEGAWSGYVENELIPRLNGFEILMASYAMAHLKLDMLLTEKGYKPQKSQRFNIYLTNSLEEHHPDTGTLFASWLSAEANEANHIKRDTPVMVVMGNPPYAVSSSNKGEWIQNLLVDYKKNLNERKINLDDDYIKFIRYGQHLINKNGEGILAYISNNSFIDGVTHRQMRKNLLETFDKVYIIDLHGSSKKKEKHPDGSKDENVFDITQGVSINIFVKKGATR
jgi:type I restriction-modification system DNA methylase subunit